MSVFSVEFVIADSELGRRHMSETSGRWLKGCALGCAGVLVVGVLFLVGMTFSLRSIFDDAHQDREVLVAQHGENDAFVPAVDGTVPSDRIEAFLAVRQALAPVCAKVEGVDREMGDFEELADDGEPELRVALPAVFRLTKTMMGLPWIFGEIERVRNRALVDADMGLGEYTYVYVMAFHDQLLDPESEARLFAGSATNNRVREDLVAMLRRQHEAAVASSGVDGEWLSILEMEVATLESDPGRIPWQDGLPEQISMCFQPYRVAVDQTYSAATAEFDLLNSTVRGGGLTIEMK